MPATPRLALISAALAAALTGCLSTCPAPPEPDNDTPERLIANLRHYVREECWSEVYDLLSERTRDSQSYATFRIGAPGLTFPGTDVLVRDILAKGTTVGIYPKFIGQKSKDERLWVFRDDIEGGEKRCRILNFLLTREGAPPHWTFGLQDQQDRGLRLCGE